MSLTATEESWIKKEKKIADLKADIQTLNDIAEVELAAKRTELTAIHTQLSSAVKVKQDAIDALNA
jgi:hypothetical protein